ncbi:DUF554 domain-containing protein [Cetobacterium sp. SF1]|uniref:DUF554 domain-containing protein n=1 Tax=unclassified Cetobacterium TaxID=2630983 RepID=UPI003CF4377F
MLGVIVNTLAVLIGSFFGLIFKNKISEKYISSIMGGIGLCTLSLGISGTLKGENPLILIGSIILGTFLGEFLDLDGKIKKLVPKNSSGNFSTAFITSSLLFTMGAMTIIGSLNAGLTGDNKMLYTKSFLDLISSLMLSATLGIGVIFSSIFVFIFQGLLVLSAKFLEPILTERTIGEITSVGSLAIIALGLNIIGLSKFKVANFLPAIIFVPILMELEKYIVL